MGILCTFWHYVHRKTFSFLRKLENPLYDALWRCPLYDTIFKSWLQDLPASIFELPNKSPSVRLRHNANDKLLNVYVPHSLAKQWLEEFALQITVLNDWRIFERKTKIKFHWWIRSAKTPGSHRESKSDLLTKKIKKNVVRMDTKGNKFLAGIRVVAPSWPQQNTFCGTHQPVPGEENPSRIELKFNIYTHTMTILTVCIWTSVDYWLKKKSRLRRKKNSWLSRVLLLL